MKVAIIGAGWYGCHIGSTLLSLGFDVTVFEAEDEILTQASGKNQNRLHQGFHYARHYNTRTQSRDGFNKFVEKYPTLSFESKCGNLYSVPKHDSLLDFQTYKGIMSSSGLSFSEQENQPWMNGIEGTLSCTERVIDITKSRKLFKKLLGSNLKLNSKVEYVRNDEGEALVNDVKFDFCIDCTWGHLVKNQEDVFYEVTHLCYYKTDLNFPAFTLVDGPLCSIYPTEDKGIYTLSSVTHTPLSTFDNPKEADEFAKNVPEWMLIKNRGLMEEHVSKYVPSFLNMFTYNGDQISIKTKIIGASDDRSCRVTCDNRVIMVQSGKIDTIAQAMDRVLYFIEQNSVQ